MKYKDLVVIIPCGFKKGKQKSKAKNLYQGPYFKSNFNWAISVAAEDHIFILSALHGLIQIDKEIEPYDLKMGNKGCVTPSTVKDQLTHHEINSKKVYAIGGGKYLQCLKLTGLKFCAPASGLPMGKSMQLLKKNLGALPLWKEY